MASKVLVKYTVAPFGHVSHVTDWLLLFVLILFKIKVNKTKSNDVGPEIITVGRTMDGIGSKCTDPLLRISQLEQNIRFLQEQHQQMITGLHEEIDSLRQRNRGIIAYL